ncbi:hypothetical protein BXY66_2091 [Shimia isoporae]|uniref:Hemolysin n=1 Tax=Shimia isoporae TaxID=647720 RepID=A0A4R1NT92_9RHOB|nr:DUF333 domain-containing protein [Shimia isoporae]TCL10023.1 hypothetical protein BXY66_2091 [Shimia isoporae]
MKAFLPVAIIACLAACTTEDTETTIGMANPASVFCVEQGGSSKIVEASDGSQSGICVLPDGSEVDEWEYYRDNNQE